MRLAVLALLILLGACSSRPEYVPRYFAPIGPGEQVLIPYDPPSTEVQLVGRVCRPDEAARLPVVVINHGAPSDPELTPQMQPADCDSEPARWFMERGYVVVFALRRGFGGSTGPIVENIGACSNPNYIGAGLRSASDVDAIVKYATHLPYTLPTGAIVIGQSTGGWAVTGYNTSEHPEVVAMISMAGGRGAHAYGIANEICRPEQLLTAVKRFGETSKAPALWIYAQNDSFFGPNLVAQMVGVYQHTGAQLAVAQVGPYGADGHGLFFGPSGSNIWGPIIEGYLATLQRTPRRY